MCESPKQAVDIEMVVIVCILHDMGLARCTPETLQGLSPDQRFEVDGANVARDFVGLFGRKSMGTMEKGWGEKSIRINGRTVKSQNRYFWVWMLWVT